MSDVVQYSRCGHSFELPRSCRYSRTHYWLLPAGEIWRVGFTPFAARVLGELVELSFESQPGDAITVGQLIGRYEGFKNLTDIYAVAAGEFVRVNSELELNGEWIKADSFGKAWLYEVRGTPDPASLEAEAYAKVLDETFTNLGAE